MPDPRIERATPLSGVQIEDIENKLGRELPNDYRDFLTDYGGAFIGGFVDGSDELPISQFFGGKENHSILDVLKLYSDLRDEKILPIADCEFGNLYVLDYDNSIHYIDYYGEETTSRRVASNFTDFLDRIVIEEN